MTLIYCDGGTRRRQRAQELDPHEFRNPVLFFANAVGDHLVALPTVRALAETFRGRLTLIALGSADCDFFGGIPFKDVLPLCTRDGTVIDWHQHWVPMEDFDEERLLRAISPCDLVITLALWESRALTRLVEGLAPRTTVGMLPTHHYHPRRSDGHIVDGMFETVRLFRPDVAPEDYSLPPTLNPRHEALAMVLRDSLGIQNHLLVVHADTKHRKMVPPLVLLRALDKFLSRWPNFLVVIVGAENVIPLETSSHAGHLVDLSGGPLSLSFALLSQADLFIGVDSSMLHAADLFRVPGVGVFGPSVPSRWGFRFSRHRHVRIAGLENTRPAQLTSALSQLWANISKCSSPADGGTRR